MKTVHVNLGERSYDIHIEFELLDHSATFLEAHHLKDQLFIITDENVRSIYGRRVSDTLKSCGINFELMSVPAGEPSKSAAVLDQLYTRLIKLGATRQAAIVAFGGGVVGDLAGFLAATYMRGVKYVQLPTTLLSQVDSSVGGKVGINHSLGKNLIGAFYHPQFVLIDPAVLKTVPVRELKAGMAEVIKYSYIRDAAFFDLLNENMTHLLQLEDWELLEATIERCCRIKAEVVNRDEKESGLRAILNFGHTIGHALEACTNYRALLHGEAVLHGMKGAVYLSHLEKKMSRRTADRCFELIEKLSPPAIMAPPGLDEIKSAMQNDKKRTDQGQLWVLLNNLGSVELSRSVSQANVNKAIEFVLREGAA